MSGLESRLAQAVRHFWSTRDKQAEAQGVKTGRKDSGFRTAVTGGKQLDGLIDLVCELLVEAGIKRPTIHCKRQVEVPGWFRATKKWDLLLVSKGQLLASIECKSIVGSFGKNLNNRTEEALGNATDLLAAYREGAFRPSLRPWLGYLILIQDHPDSTSPVAIKEPHFKVFEEFRNSSYIERSRILLTKLLREQLYDGACLLSSPREAGTKRGEYREPDPELTFRKFVESLLAKAVAFEIMNS